MDAFRNFLRGWLGRALLAGVLVIFVVTMFWSATPPGTRGEIAEVNGEPIFAAELDQAVETIMSRYEGKIDRKTLEEVIKREDVLESLIRQRALVDVSRDLGLLAHPHLVQETIQGMDGFKDAAGKFSPELFQQLIQRNGYANAAEFRKRISEELLSQQLTGALRDSSFVTRQDIELLTRIGEQQRDVAWLVLSPAAFAPAVSVTDADVQARYDANPAGYMSEEQFAIDYVQIDLDDYAASQQISEADLRAKYDQMVSQANQNAERHVAHILIATGKDRNDQQAKARADEVIAKLAAGESFVKVAAQYSDDAGTRDHGGDLGFIGVGVLDAPLDSALSHLKVNDVSAAVKSDDGYHLLKLLAVRAVETPPFALARDGILASLRRDRAREKYDALLEDLGTQMYESDNLQDPAAKLGLQVRSTGLFGRTGGPGIAANPKVLKELMSADVLEDGRNSGVIQVTADQAVVLHLKEHRKPSRRPFAEVAAMVRTELLAERAAALAQQKVKALRDAVVAGQTLDAVAAANALVVQRVAGARRVSQGVPREILQAAFKAKVLAGKPDVVETIALADGSHALMAVGNQVDGNLLTTTPEDIASRRAQLAVEFGRIDFTHFVEQSAADAKVTRVRAKDAKDDGKQEDQVPGKQG